MTKEEIISVLCELHRITGFRVSLHAADYSEIAAYPQAKSQFCVLVHGAGEYQKCVECDKIACKIALEKKDTYIYKCRYGLTEAISPIYNFGTLTGFLVMGQVYEDSATAKSLLSDLSALGVGREDAERACAALPQVRSDMVRSYVKIMTICARYLTISNAIPSAKPTVAELAKKYIYENYSKKFGIREICSSIGCSKSTLITAFKKQYGITVNSYITEVRLTEAERMLAAGDGSVGEVAARCGFSDQSYFSKVFSAKHGIPPSEYGKGHQ